MDNHDISEDPHPHRPRTLSFYLVLFATVIPLWVSVPAAWIFSFHTLYSHGLHLPSFTITKKAFLFVAICEVVFSLYHFYCARRVAGPSPCAPAHPDEIQVAYLRLLKAGLANLPEDGGDIETLQVDRPGSPAETITLLDKHDPRAIEFRHCLRTWFRKVPWSSIKRHEILQWLYWAMYNAALPPQEELTEDRVKALEDALELLEKRLGCKVDDGSDPSIVPVRLTIDKVNILWRPFTFYVIVGGINWCLKKIYSHWWDVRYGYDHGIEYLIRWPANWDPLTSPRPIVFIHGLGLGILQYHSVIGRLLESFRDRPILIPLQPQISQDFFHPHFLKPVGRHQMADRLANLLEGFGWVKRQEHNRDATRECEEEKEVASSLIEDNHGVTVLSHSNGSYTHAWMLKTHPDMITRSAFADPVTFCSWEGDVCYNFFYRPAVTGIELMMRYFVGTEIGVANYLQRHFDWTSNSLWFEEIPNARDPHKTLFLLGGKDDIIHAERVKRYLTSHGVRKNLWYDPAGRHGQALMKGGAGFTELLRWLKEEES